MRCWQEARTRPAFEFGLEGLQVDLRALPKESYGAALQYFTGSKEHSIPLRSRAQKMGLTLSEYSLSRVDTKEIVARETEEQIYEALGLRWIPPELRENQGEIEAAEAGTLPKLVELGDIRGDLHMHTTRERRPGDARRDGRGGARAGIRVHRDHGPFQSSGDGQRTGRETRDRVRASGSRDGSERAWAFACSRASNATFAATAPWTWRRRAGASSIS